MLPNVVNCWGMRLVKAVVPLTVIFYGLGLYQALWASPGDIFQGDYVRIMYVHVPSAWLAVGIYAAMGVISAIAVIYESRFADYCAYSLAPIGTIFCLICLLTGAIWGKPVWGTWWVWDPRLTSMLILFFLYLGYLILWDYDIKSCRSAAILNIIGLINIPIIKYSVQLWNSIHQKSSVTLKGLSIAPSMMLPLMLMFAGSVGFAFTVWILRLKILDHEVKDLQQNLN